MAKFDADHIKKILRQNADEIDTVAAYDTSSGEKCDLVTGGHAALCEAIDDWAIGAGNPVRVKAWSSKLDGKGGRRSEKETPFVWVLMPARDAQPVARPASAPVNSAAPATSVEEITRRVTAELELAYAKKELLAQRERLDAIEEELEEIADQPMQAAAAPAPRPFWEDEERLINVVDKVYPKLEGLFMGMGLKKPTAALNGARSAADIPTTGVEPELRTMLDIFKQSDPERYAMVMEQLVVTYGPEAVKKAQAAANGQG